MNGIAPVPKALMVGTGGAEMDWIGGRLDDVDDVEGRMGWMMYRRVHGGHTTIR